MRGEGRGIAGFSSREGGVQKSEGESAALFVIVSIVAQAARIATTAVAVTAFSKAHNRRRGGFESGGIRGPDFELILDLPSG
jgi:hypothetical protein